MTDVIRDMPIDERPREKLFRHGVGILSNADLGGLLIGSGTPGMNAIQLARMLLKEGGGSFATLRKRNPKEFVHLHGLGDAKIARVWAAMELGYRLLNEEPAEPEPYEQEIVGRTLISQYSHRRQEHLGAVLLDARHRILKQHEIYIGTVDSALVSTRDIISSTLLENAVGLVLFHNHPSGSSIPSDPDIEFTEKLKVALPLCDIKLVDHLIIGANGYCSMKARGFI
jgi:DNA repair protein RadC